MFGDRYSFEVDPFPQPAYIFLDSSTSAMAINRKSKHHVFPFSHTQVQFLKNTETTKAKPDTVNDIHRGGMSHLVLRADFRRQKQPTIATSIYPS